MAFISFKLNGQSIQAANVEPHTTLLNWLRTNGYTGSKEGCGEGECGACAVLLVTPSPDGASRYTAANGCLILMGTLHGQEILTVEGLGSLDQLHPVQISLARAGGSQCGYCTPGFVVSMAGEYYRPQREHFDLEAVTGNLCRCTGYRPIRDAALNLGQPEPSDPLALRLRDPAPQPAHVTLHGAPQADAHQALHRPTSLTELFTLLEAQPAAKLVAGGTDWVVEINQRAARSETQIAILDLPELRSFHETPEHFEVGAALTLSEVHERLAGRVPLLSELFPLFASVLIRNRATLGGNLATASPVGDSAPALLALDAQLVLARHSGTRVVPLDEFFTGYRQTAMQPGEVIQAVRIPRRAPSTSRFYKVAKRPTDDISTVAAAFALQIEGGVITSARIGLGGVAATPARAYRAEQALRGQPWNAQTLQAARRELAGEFAPISDHRGSAAYRAQLLPRLLEKFYVETQPQEVPA